MELSTALNADNYTREEVALYLELMHDFIKQFQSNCPSIHDYLCVKAIDNGDTALTDASNALSNALAILNQHPTVKVSSLDVPTDWKKPKFKLGQSTKQGLIVGMRYMTTSRLDTTPYIDSRQKWVYLVQVGEELKSIDEFKIELLSKEELTSKLKGEIKYYYQRINALQEQFKQCLKN